MDHNLSQISLVNSYLTSLQSKFKDEIFTARNGLESSLEFDKTILKSSKKNYKTLTQVLYIGASHIESALVQTDSYGKEKIIEFSSQEINFIRSQKEFFNLIQNNLKPNVKSLNINIAAHIKSVNRNGFIDGILVQNHRQHNLSEFIGLPFGEIIEKFLEDNLGQEIRVGVRNNLVSLGLLSRQNKVYKNSQTLIGIVASGVNFGFFEKEKFINLESGKFKSEDFNLGDFIKIPGLGNEQNRYKNVQKTFEPLTLQISELIGESYLWENYNKIVKVLNIKIPLLKTRKDFREALKSQDIIQNRLANQLLKLSAKLVASKISGLINYKKLTDKNFNQTKINFLIEGSLFWEVFGYKRIVEETLTDLGFAKDCINFVRIQNGFVLGALVELAVPEETIRRKVRILEKVTALIRVFEFQLRGPPLYS